MTTYVRISAAWIAACVMAACSGIGGGTPPQATGTATQAAWSAPDAKRSTLLYVSDANDGQVSVFSYPQGVLMQTLTGFEEPYGLCADKAGDVWIVDDETSMITEYAHGGTSAKATLSDSGEYPAGCSVDPTTGNLAVTNYETASRGQGGISLYKKAKGNPTVLTDTAISRGWFCSYDNKGNLYLDGDTAGSSGFQLAVLPHGSSTFTNISVNEKITVPGGVQWDGKYVAVSDANGPGPGSVYQFSISGSTATEVSTSVLQDAQNIHQFWIDASRRRIVAPSASLSTVGYWKFPAGNDPTKTISGLDIPEGVAISKAGK